MNTLTLADILATVRDLEAKNPLPKVIYVRDDAWDVFCEAVPETESKGLGWYGIPVERVSQLPRPWMTDIDLDLMAAEMAQALPFSTDVVRWTLLEWGASAKAVLALASSSGVGVPARTKHPKEPAR